MQKMKRGTLAAIWVALACAALTVTSCAALRPSPTLRPTSTLVPVTPRSAVPTDAPSQTTPLGESSQVVTASVRANIDPNARPTEVVDPTLISRTGTPSLRTSTGKVNKVETLADKRMHVQIIPDDIAMHSDFTISDWSHVSVLFYWTGRQTPTPQPDAQRPLVIQRAALNHQVTIGYYDTNPPIVVMFSVHKQEGDPQR